jgi:hypothetical protein
LGDIVEPPPEGALPWKPAPHPYNEMERLHFLQEMGLLDTEPENRFDAVTKIIARVFDTPIALVSLVDEDKLPLKNYHRQHIPVAVSTPQNLQPVPSSPFSLLHSANGLNLLVRVPL